MEITFKSLLKTFKKRLIPIIILVVLVVCLALTYCGIRQTTVYSSQAQLYIKVQAPLDEDGNPTAIINPGPGTLTYIEYIFSNAYVLLLSNEFGEIVREELATEKYNMQLSVQEIISSLTYKRYNSTSVMIVTAKNASPEVATAIVSVVSDKINNYMYIKDASPLNYSIFAPATVASPSKTINTALMVLVSIVAAILVSAVACFFESYVFAKVMTTDNMRELGIPVLGITNTANFKQTKVMQAVQVQEGGEQE